MMLRRPRTVFVSAILLVMLSAVAFSQSRRWRGGSGYGWGGRDWRDAGRNGVPEWETDPDFETDLFTFVRIRYESWGGRGGRWATDYRDSDLNFSLRLHQLTSLKVNPEPIVLDLTDDRLFDYPFIYMIEPGELYFRDDEVTALRKYCYNGGFLMVDDFWGDREYQNLAEQLRRVFPDRTPSEVPLEHEIFHNVYDLKEKPQVPAIGQARRRADGSIETWERSWNNDTETPHYRAIYDDAGRIMVFICHNTDLGDGWEREGEDPWYFNEFSVKKAYPLGINIVTYAMTH
ncbi:DUF4159 domain-containing protein [Crateriforma conspicua]|uniref:DUF4159 domain-containing protein n=1 Tax=Crateriforma conspicua TaxID=2527996 RepID=A0A5C5Y3E2_9PLAN|nr:DUF4159 domain-containing protein [Crateriforma conspicua]QDV63218.1 hypothetical protein Mal65_23600 [Crateriforma conspicua]TWT68012.1 hypothetical protein Pan14r_02500 [Crateriforma conspicua]